jgi:tRNA N6-adenosine threonylcarbamoyltransferase
MARLAGIEVVADVLAKKINGNEGESPSSSTAGRANSRVVDLSDTRSADSSVVDLDVDVTSPAGDTDTSYQAHFAPKVTYPFLALLASGGHTSILLCRELGEYQILGGTLDDALGEALGPLSRQLLGGETKTHSP